MSDYVVAMKVSKKGYSLQTHIKGKKIEQWFIRLPIEKATELFHAHVKEILSADKDSK